MIQLANVRHELGVTVTALAEQLARLGGHLLGEELHVHADEDFAKAYAQGRVDAGVHL